MAILQEQRSNQSIFLGALHVFGRNPARADTLLGNPDASQLHASIRWNGGRWELVDHSRFGTWIDGQTVPANAKVTLEVGQTIRFAPGATQLFKVKNLDAPCPMLVPKEDNLPPIALTSIHLLPDEGKPEATIRLDANGQWLFDNGQNRKVLYDGDTLHMAEREYLFFNKLTVNQTIDSNTELEQPKLCTPFHFSVSQNEEHIHLSIKLHGKSIDLGERSHHYCLLLLARKRHDDAKMGYDDLSQGWLATANLADSLKVEEKHLNMMVHRVKTQIDTTIAPLKLVSPCIERRRGELRFGSHPFQIKRGIELEAEFHPIAPKFAF